MAKNGAGSEPIGKPLNLSKNVRIIFKESLKTFYSLFKRCQRITITIHLAVIFYIVSILIQHTYFISSTTSERKIQWIDLILSKAWGSYVHRVEKLKVDTCLAFLRKLSWSIESRTGLFFLDNRKSFCPRPNYTYWIALFNFLMK